MSLAVLFSRKTKPNPQNNSEYAALPASEDCPKDTINAFDVGFVVVVVAVPPPTHPQSFVMGKSRQGRSVHGSSRVWQRLFTSWQARNQRAGWEKGARHNLPKPSPSHLLPQARSYLRSFQTFEKDATV